MSRHKSVCKIKFQHKTVTKPFVPFEGLKSPKITQEQLACLAIQPPLNNQSGTRKMSFTEQRQTQNKKFKVLKIWRQRYHTGIHIQGR